MKAPSGRLASPSPETVVREFEGETVILHLGTEEFYGLNPVGARLWSLLSASPSVEQAYRTLLDEYDVDPETLRQDVDSLVDELLKQDLIQLVDE